MSITVADDAQDNGLALMVAELIRQNIEDQPQKAKVLRKMRGRVAIVADDAGVAMTMLFDSGSLLVQDGIVGIPDMTVRADSAQVVTMSQVEFTFGGLPDLRGRYLREVVAASRSGQIQVFGALSNPLLALRLTRLMSVR